VTEYRLNKFEQMLARALKERTEPVPADSSERLLKELRAAEAQRVLRRAVLEQRIALAICITTAAAAIFGLVTMAGILRTVPLPVDVFASAIGQTVKILCDTWRYLVVLAGLSALIIYSFAYLLVGDA